MQTVAESVKLGLNVGEFLNEAERLFSRQSGDARRQHGQAAAHHLEFVTAIHGATLRTCVPNCHTRHGRKHAREDPLCERLAPELAARS